MTLIVYADFGSAEGYLASRRASALGAAGIAVDWRALQRRSTRRFDGLDALLLPGETLPRTSSTPVTDTEAAVSAYAEAYGTAVADDVRRLLFDLYWSEGADIGNPNVLRTPLAGPMLRAHAGPDSMRQVGYAVSVNGGPITTEAYRRIRAWRVEWEQLGRPALPVVLIDGATLVSVDAVRRLGKELFYRGADVDPELKDPRRYPAVPVRPSPSWVSQIGGRWRDQYKLGPTA